jgi:hypothetical protein
MQRVRTSPAALAGRYTTSARVGVFADAPTGAWTRTLVPRLEFVYTGERIGVSGNPEGLRGVVDLSECRWRAVHWTMTQN